jgi:hypothetical protein
MTDADTAQADALRGRGLQARAHGACCTFALAFRNADACALLSAHAQQAVDAAGTELSDAALHFASARAGPATVFITQAREQRCRVGCLSSR